MGSLVVQMSVSVDGFMEGPGHDLSWHLISEELHQHFNDELRAMTAFLSGRVTYELMAEFWPTADQEPDSSPAMAEFAGIWREKPKYVWSRTLADVTAWRTTVLREVDPDHVRDLKARGDVVAGGAAFAAELQRLGLVDEYRVYVHPVAIGAGTPLFPAGQHLDLRLRDTREFENGVVGLRYAVS